VRWFTRERDEDADFDDWDGVSTAYAAYIESIRSRLPQDLQRLTPPDGFDLHDAEVDIAEIDLVRRTAHIRFLTAGGAQFVDCRYGDADFGESNLRNLEYAIEARVPRRDATGTILSWVPLGNVLYAEITALDDRLKHSFIIEPLGDFAVEFRSFSLSSEPSPEGRLPERNQRYLLTNEWSKSEGKT
jgi:hypothetical protein